MYVCYCYTALVVSDGVSGVGRSVVAEPNRVPPHPFMLKSYIVMDIY